MRAMIGIDFTSFLILLVISAIVSAILHYGFKLYIVPGTASYLSKVALGWFGAWLGSPILGHWWAGLNYQHVYFVPSILGSFAILILVIDGIKSLAKAWSSAASGSQSS
jgi:uncharacterized membrane protein YeaQ/YmgE (transglycosylase-associated protein family)